MPMIIGEIKRFLRDGSALKVGRAAKDLAYRALTAREELSKRGDNEPDLYEISAYLGEERRDIENALDAISDPVSLFEPVNGAEGDTFCLAEKISDGEDEAWIDRIALQDAMRKCTPRERQILTLRYYRGKTQTEAALEAGVSQAQISRIEKCALEKLRRNMC